MVLYARRQILIENVAQHAPFCTQTHKHIQAQADTKHTHAKRNRTRDTTNARLNDKYIYVVYTRTRIFISSWPIYVYSIYI